MHLKICFLFCISLLVTSCSREVDYDTGLPFISLRNQGATLEKVQHRGFVRCGVSTGLKGFSIANIEGQWSGLDVDFCRAVAVAVLGDAALVRFIPLTARDRFSALANREVDLLARNTTWTMNRDMAVGLRSAGINYFDGQGFLVNQSVSINNLEELDGRSICVQNATTSQLNMADWFRRNHLNYHPVLFDSAETALAAFVSGQCVAFTSDQSQLFAHIAKHKPKALGYVMEQVISKEPLGPMVRANDDQWFNIVKWTLNSLIAAEEMGVTQANVRQFSDSENPAIRRLLGQEGQFGEVLGLSPDWVANIIVQVGNYGEIFARNLGAQSEMNFNRGLNRLWNEGGLMYPLPVR